MESIQSSSYPVHFGENGYQALNKYLLETSPTKIFILVDENTHHHCLSLLLQEIRTDITFEIVEISSGEENKNLDTCVQLWHTLTELGADRKSLLLNLGGGVITDMGGFVASCFKRGIAFINFPTTLLSMVDASVGGKTGVDLGVLKNQIGVFADPQMVVIDFQFLDTVPQKEIVSGQAEIIKYGISYDKSLWNHFKEGKSLLNPEIIHRSIVIKNEIVLEDRLESGLRKVLNFGHTLGHAVESHFLLSDHKEKLTHGEAIAVGMIGELYASHITYGFDINSVDDIKKEIKTLFGHVTIEKEDLEPILDYMKHDKKNKGGSINFVLVSDFEKYQIDSNISKDLILESINYYLS